MVAIRRSSKAGSPVVGEGASLLTHRMDRRSISGLEVSTTCAVSVAIGERDFEQHAVERELGAELVRGDRLDDRPGVATRSHPGPAQPPCGAPPGGLSPHAEAAC